MEKYKVIVDEQVVDDGLTYREACELASEIDADPRYYWNDVDVVPEEE